MIYVDAIGVYPNAWGPFRAGSCHMFARLADVEALHEFARRIGLKREWFQPDPCGGYSHYDLTVLKRAMAIKLGAIEVNRNQAVTIWRENRAAFELDNAPGLQCRYCGSETIQTVAEHNGCAASGSDCDMGPYGPTPAQLRKMATE